MVAIYFAQIHDINKKKRKNYIKSLRRLSQDIKVVTTTLCKEAEDIAQNLVEQKSMFVLGKGAMIPVAEEGALKTKEIGYIHSEAYGGNALRHGPYALIEDGTPIIFVSPTDTCLTQCAMGESHFAQMNNTIEEVKSREAQTIMVTNAERSKVSLKADHTIIVPSNPHYQGVLLNIPLQLIAYYLSVLKGNDPDKPRHLSKCVSV
jgi:glucosamine--fructose-6-phosphate aminotransferase (isomerizing)